MSNYHVKYSKAKSGFCVYKTNGSGIKAAGPYRSESDANDERDRLNLSHPSDNKEGE